MKKIVLPALFSFNLFFTISAYSQQKLETGGQKMPDEWIDSETGHRVIKLTRNGGSNLSFYFHNNPFIGDKMVYYGSRANEEKRIFWKMCPDNGGGNNSLPELPALVCFFIIALWFWLRNH